RSLLFDREGCSLREDGHQTVGVLGLDPCLEVYAQKHGKISVGDAFHQPNLPPEPGSSHREAAHRVTSAVMAIAEGPLAVLPRLAPEDRREAHEDGTLGELCREREPRLFRHLRAQFERVLERRVVVDCRSRVKTGDGAGNQVALGRVKIAARWIYPEGPAGPSGLFPGGEGERILEEPRNA